MNDIANVRIDRIIRGDRHRKSFGRIDELAESIAQLGLLQPIGIDRGRRLIFGARRIAAFEHLGRKTIPARVIAIDDLLDGEHAENLIRKDFTVSERVAIGKSMAARLGERRGGDRGNQYTGGKAQDFAECQGEETRDLAAEYAGFGNHETYRQAEKVCDQGVPELVELMDDEGISVSMAARLTKLPEGVQRRAVELMAAANTKPTEALRQIKAEEILREVSAPTAKYRILYADPPWSYSNTQPDYQTDPRDYYPTTPMEDLCAIPVSDWCESNAVLFIWVTSPMLEDSFRLINAWGFKYKTSFVWDKVKHNMGHYNSVRHELLLVCVKGSCMPDVPKLFDSVITEERREHSKKPAVIYEMIDTLYPHGKRLELFARASPDGWDAYGHEA